MPIIPSGISKEAEAVAYLYELLSGIEENLAINFDDFDNAVIALEDAGYSRDANKLRDWLQRYLDNTMYGKRGAASFVSISDRQVAKAMRFLDKILDKVDPDYVYADELDEAKYNGPFYT